LKKLIAISLLFIHLFNVGGPLALHQYLVYKSDRFYNKQIAKNLYNTQDLTEIKVPVSLHNTVVWSYYQNLEGRIQFKNTAYNYVKIKITKSFIYLLCVPNYETTHLADHNVIYARQISDIPVSKKEHVPFGKISLTVYNHELVLYSFSVPLIETRKIIINKQVFMGMPVINGPGQPPDKTTFLS
jgi:hypothetical protein